MWGSDLQLADFVLKFKLIFGMRIGGTDGITH